MIINGIKTKKVVIYTSIITAILIPICLHGIWGGIGSGFEFSSARSERLFVLSIVAPIVWFFFLRKTIREYRKTSDRVKLEVRDEALYVNDKKVFSQFSDKVKVTVIGFLTGSNRYAISFTDENKKPLRDPIRHYSFDHHLEDFANALPKDFKVKRQTFFGL
ncbi:MULTISPECIES: hypothetical protein [Gammaproteobacteria]|uniref:hypothetical protein n=1 Tax=Gammaproteobacteria TaxID=1236 RepID=UPI000DCFAA0F|nr:MULTISPECIES: hypothetical protein [Gammaproteobacteria]RTE85495.1 hypothetical protein DQX04_11370 [Aliidiomarina sp. B3213]TCZ89463.1 hypothetical protein EYQ95_11290 [Lysobacter sp. N42]